MTAVQLLDSHKGCHCRKPVSPVASFFRRAIAAVRRRLPVPAARPAGTGTVLLSHPATDPAGVPVLRDRTLSEVRAERNAGHADAIRAGYASAVDRLRQEAGLPTVAQMHAMRAGSPQWAFPPLEEPQWAEPQPRGPVHDTRMDLYAPHYAPDVPVYGQAPVARVLEAERLAQGLIA